MTAAGVIQPSASIASTGLGLRYIGEHCYAFSGPFPASSTTQTLFDFTTGGSGYIVATLTMTGPVKMTAVHLGFARGYQLDFNGQTVGVYKMETQSQDMPTTTEAQILIPPSTAVVLTCFDSGTDADYNGTANITGRVYGVV